MMNIMRNAVIIFIILGSAVWSLDYLLKEEFMKSVDSETGSVVISGINKEVVISRDSLGVPCIDADSEEDLFFATGYVSASDRLWQMVMMKMLTRGRLSEIAGKEVLSFDFFMRTLDFRRHIDETMKNIDGHTRMMLESFSRGVNAYIQSHPHLPPEFVLTGYLPEQWEPEDSLYVFALLSLNLSFNMIEELDFLNLASRVGYEKAAYLFPVYPDQPLPFDEARKLAGIGHRDLNMLTANWGAVRDRLQDLVSAGIPASNNWAVSGAKTGSGRSIVANDTHLALMMPNTWMLLHQRCPQFEAAGVVPPGVPLVALGYNGKIAWGATMVMADSQDLYIEKLREIDGVTHYLHRGKWLPVSVRTESFRVRGDRDVSFRMSSTLHGPILNDALMRSPMPPEMPVQPLPLESQYGVALCYAIGDGSATIQGFYNCARAQSMDEMRAAISQMESVYLNIVYGDKDNIAWQVSGRFPLRKTGRGHLPSPGWTGLHDWIGFAPFRANPHVMNPPEGYVATANNRTVSPNYPLLLSSSWYNPERAERLHQVLKKTRKTAALDTARLQFDRYSLMAKKAQDMLFEPETRNGIISAARGLGGDMEERVLQALGLLKPGSFDAVMDEESAAAALMGAFFHCAAREIFLDELGPEEGIAWNSFMDASMISYSAPQDHILYRKDSPFWDDTSTGVTETRYQILARSLSAAVGLCRDRIGRNSSGWAWGKLHTYHWRHEFTRAVPLFHGYFNRGPYPAGGDGHTINVATSSWGEGFEVRVIPAMRLIVDFGLDEPAFLIGTHGQSGNPSSKHYDDMLPYYLEGRTHPIPFGQKAVEKQYANRLVLKPVPAGGE